MEKKLKIIVYFLLVTIVLSGCSLGFGIGNFINSKNSVLACGADSLIAKLSKYNVRVIKNINSIALILPSKSFFVKDSANFTNNVYEATDLIISLAQYYKDPSITIVGYKRDNDPDFANALAMERARRMMRQLWQSGIDATFVYTDNGNMLFSHNHKKNRFFSDDSVVIRINGT